MPACRLRLTYPPERVRDPVVATLVRRFDVIPNIRRARVSEDAGELVLEIEGASENLDRATAYLHEIGIVVEPLEGDILAS